MSYFPTVGAIISNSFVDDNGETVDTAARLTTALEKWRNHDSNDKYIIDGDVSYDVWEENSSGASGVDGADYFNLGSCLRVGEKFILRAKLNVQKDGSNVDLGAGNGPVVFSAGSGDDRTHDARLYQFNINLIP